MFHCGWSLRWLVLLALGVALPAPGGEGGPPPGALPPLSAGLGEASARTEGDRLIVTTGKIERVWRLTEKGLATVSLKNTVSGKQWAAQEAAHPCDWCVPPLLDERASGRLVTLKATPMHLSRWTSPHLEVLAEFDYPEAGLKVQHVTWAYPGVPGLRTQLRLQAIPVQGTRGEGRGAGDEKEKGGGGRAAGDEGKAKEDKASGPPGAGPARSEYIPVVFGQARRRAAGYVSAWPRGCLREESFEGPLAGTEDYSWASVLRVEQGAEGLTLVQESHKCANQAGVDTGAFRCSPRGIAVSGLGPGPRDILRTRARECWAVWAVVSTGGDSEHELAVHRFDRARFPIDPRRDVYIMANPWGGGHGAAASSEANILREIESAADLGIDVQQIDAGWEHGPWQLRREFYPQGWTNVVAAARRRGMRLGIWFTGAATEGDLVRQFEAGGFRYFKLDNIDASRYADLEALLARARTLLERSGQTARINWDITEPAARVGYFFAREYGNLFTTNWYVTRDMYYSPHLALREAWHVAKYVNLSSLQIVVQNVELVPPDKGNAAAYSHGYVAAMALMGSPLFFQETHLLSKEAREQIRPLLAVYKKHRAEIYSGYVFPIGGRPDDQSWTGFQCHLPEKNAGYLTIFREAGNNQQVGSLGLRFLAGKKIQLTNLLTEKERTVELGAEAKLDFNSPKAPHFGFLRYEVVP